jgi:UTP--glucose-1-phosphate uridylyltransferase
MGRELNYLVIPAAGLGTRMRAVNPDLPKEMLPIVNKPAIQYAVEEGLSVGIKNIIIIISKSKEIIRKYFEEKKTREKLYPLEAEKTGELIKECTLTFLYQKKPLGEVDAIRLSRPVVEDNPLAIIYPDDIYFPSPGVLRVLKAAFTKFRTDVIALMKITEENAPVTSNSGRVDLIPVKKGIYKIRKFFPKDKGHFVLRQRSELKTCGISISGSHIFQYIEKARPCVKEKEFTDGILHTTLLKDKELLGCSPPGKIFDIGNPQGYKYCLRATQQNA